MDDLEAINKEIANDIVEEKASADDAAEEVSGLEMWVSCKGGSGWGAVLLKHNSEFLQGTNISFLGKGKSSTQNLRIVNSRDLLIDCCFGYEAELETCRHWFPHLVFFSREPDWKTLTTLITTSFTKWQWCSDWSSIRDIVPDYCLEPRRRSTTIGKAIVILIPGSLKNDCLMYYSYLLLAWLLVFVFQTSNWRFLGLFPLPQHGRAVRLVWLVFFVKALYQRIEGSKWRPDLDVRCHLWLL